MVNHYAARDAVKPSKPLWRSEVLATAALIVFAAPIALAYFLDLGDLRFLPSPVLVLTVAAGGATPLCGARADVDARGGRAADRRSVTPSSVGCRHEVRTAPYERAPPDR